MLRKSFFVLLALLLLVGSVSALTGKISNARVVLYPEVTPTKPAFISRTFDVTNVNDVAVNVMLEVNEDCSKIIKLSPDYSDFILQPEQSKKVPFTIKVTQPGSYECKINVYFTTVEAIGPGVALSSVIIIKAKGEGPVVPPEDNTTIDENITSPPENNDGVTGGVSVNPGGKPKINTPVDYNKIFAIGFFVLMLVVVVLLALFAMKKRREAKNDQTKM